MTVGQVMRDTTSGPFFDGTARGELLIRQCGGCGRFNGPAAQTCPACKSIDLAWVAASGRGVLDSWTVVHEKARNRDVPAKRTAVGVIELAEGPWLESQLVDVDPDALTFGQQLLVAFESAAGGEAVPVFGPA